MTPITERLKLTEEGSLASETAFLKNYLKINYPEDDAIIVLMWKGLLGAADNYCGNPFLYEDGTPVPIPYEIGIWALENLARHYEIRMTGISSVSYGSSLGSVSLNGEDMAILDRWRRLPGI